MKEKFEYFSSVCNVNSNEMMNPATGHLSIKKAGDYFISFSANLVSVKSQAIWCALYKQSASKEGWEVLGNLFHRFATFSRSNLNEFNFFVYFQV